MEQRKGTLRRTTNSLFMSNGEVQESKLFSILGKSICAYMLLAFTESILKQEYILLILLLVMVAPDLLRKFLEMRTGARVAPDATVVETTMTSPATIETKTITPNKPKRRVDNPEN